MPRAAIFDIDGTLVDTVDLHGLAWHRAFTQFGHDVSFEEARSQIGKGGDRLVPVFLSEAEQKDHGAAMEQWRGDLFRREYLPLVKPFTAVPELLQRVRRAGLRTAAGSSSKKPELDTYLKLAGVAELMDVTVSSDDVQASKPDPDVFHAALDKLGVPAADAIVIGDSPYDAIAARKAGLRCIGLLSGCFREQDLRDAGCVAVYPGPAALWACFDRSPLAE